MVPSARIVRPLFLCFGDLQGSLLPFDKTDDVCYHTDDARKATVAALIRIWASPAAFVTAALSII
jgi:hypothetical protein